MKSPLLCMATAILVFMLSSFTSTEYRKWQKLGERKVQRALDHDEIKVGLRDGVFSKLKITVRHSGIHLHKLVVHYGNGERDELEVREDISRGGESRVIDLRGNKRVISTVDFWYDTKGGIFNDKAVVELWAR
jgi:hypothetical protein